MATINPTGYPLRIQIPQGQFTLTDSDTTEIIYHGTSYPFPDSSTAVIDIAEILRGYITAPHYDNLFNPSGTIVNQSGFIYTIKLDASDTTATNKFIWNYSAKPGNSISTAGSSLSKYPDTRVFNGMWLPCTSIYTDNRSILLKSFSSTSDPGTTHTQFPDLGPSTALNIRLVAVKMSISSDEKVLYRFYNSTGSRLMSPYLESQGTCPPDNLYTLYYVNMNGGIDFVHCTGTFKKKTNVTRNSFTGAPVIDNPAKHSMTNYSTDTYTSYTLNTGFMTDRQSEDFQDIFKSPSVWLYDYRTSSFTAINITDTSSDVKRKDLNHLFNYTISARDSQTYTINS